MSQPMDVKHWNMIEQKCIDQMCVILQMYYYLEGYSFFVF